MWFGSVGTFAIGVIFLSFSANIKSAPSVDPLDENVSPLEDSENVSDLPKSSANVDSNEGTASHSDGIPRIMKIEISERLKNLRDDLSGNWNNYVLEGRKKWGKKSLTYSVHYYDKFPEQLVDYALKIAFSKWAAVTPLEFTQLVNKAQSADMKIQFAIFRSPDGGPSRAAACSPGPNPEGIMISFSLSIPWTLQEEHGPNAACVACHEIGHGLGLLHSENPRAIMHAQADCINRAHFELDADDIAGVQAIYGRGNKPAVKPTPVPTSGQRGGYTGQRGGYTGGHGGGMAGPLGSRPGGWPEIQTVGHPPPGLVGGGYAQEQYAEDAPGVGDILGGLLAGFGGLLGNLSGGITTSYAPRWGEVYSNTYTDSGHRGSYGAPVKTGVSDSGDSSDDTDSSSDSSVEDYRKDVKETKQDRENFQKWANEFKRNKSFAKRVVKLFTSG